MSVDLLPGTCAAAPRQQQDSQKHNVLREVRTVEIRTINRFVRRDILPGNNGKKKNIQPPAEQQHEIEQPNPNRALRLSEMRLHS